MHNLQGSKRKEKSLNDKKYKERREWVVSGVSLAEFSSSVIVLMEKIEMCVLQICQYQTFCNWGQLKL